MQHLEASGAVRPLQSSLRVKGLKSTLSVIATSIPILSKFSSSLRFHHKTLYAHPLPPYLPNPPPPKSILLDFVTTATQIMQLHTMQSPAVKALGLHSGPNNSSILYSRIPSV